MNDHDTPEHDMDSSYLPMPQPTPEQEAEYDAYLAQVAKWKAAGLCGACGSGRQLYGGYCGACLEPTEINRD